MLIEELEDLEDLYSLYVTTDLGLRCSNLRPGRHTEIFIECI